MPATEHTSPGTIKHKETVWNCIHVQLGHMLNPKDTRRPKTQLLLLRSWEQKAASCACPLHATPPKGWAKHLSHLPSLTPGHTPILTPCKEKACPSLGASQQGNLLFVLIHPCCSKCPNKGFLVWPLINFYWLKRPRTLVGSTNYVARVSLCWTISLSIPGTMTLNYQPFFCFLICQGLTDLIYSIWKLPKICSFSIILLFRVKRIGKSKVLRSPMAVLI